MTKLNHDFTISEKIKRSIFKQIFFSENIASYYLFSLYKYNLSPVENEENSNIDHKRKLIFIHNPKTAGTTLRQVLKLPKRGMYFHYTPTFLVSKKTWENYFSIVSIRNPLSRFISAYYFFTSPKYRGYYLRAYPNLHSMNPKEFFETFKNDLFMILRQYRYIRHYLSTKPVDFIIRVENLKSDLKKLAKTADFKINLHNIPILNAGKYDNNNKITKNKKLVHEIKEFYRRDYEIFGY